MVCALAAAPCPAESLLTLSAGALSWSYPIPPSIPFSLPQPAPGPPGAAEGHPPSPSGAARGAWPGLPASATGGSGYDAPAPGASVREAGVTSAHTHSPGPARLFPRAVFMQDAQVPPGQGGNTSVCSSTGLDDPPRQELRFGEEVWSARGSPPQHQALPAPPACTQDASSPCLCWDSPGTFRPADQ